MPTRKIEIRENGDTVYIVSRKGIERGVVSDVILTKLNKIKYAIQTPSIKTRTHRHADEVFDNVAQLLIGYALKQPVPFSIQFKPCTYEQWYEVMSENMDAQYAESGADREMDFDLQQALEDDYQKYLQQFNKQYNEETIT